TNYKNNIKIVTGVGDSQTTFSDNLYWDGTPFPTNSYNSYYDNTCGNLLQADFEHPPGSGNCDCSPVTHVLKAEAVVDCLHWFLYVYYGESTCLDSSMRITKK